jgi:hypothetical protein
MVQQGWSAYASAHCTKPVEIVVADKVRTQVQSRKVAEYVGCKSHEKQFVSAEVENAA